MEGLKLIPGRFVMIDVNAYSIGSLRLPAFYWFSLLLVLTEDRVYPYVISGVTSPTQIMTSEMWDEITYPFPKCNDDVSYTISWM